MRKEIVKINERYVEYFGPVSLLLFLSDMDDDDEEEKCIFECCNHRTKLIWKVITENYKLVPVYGGTHSARPLPLGVETSSNVNNDNNNDDNSEDDGKFH